MKVKVLRLLLAEYPEYKIIINVPNTPTASKELYFDEIYNVEINYEKETVTLIAY